MQSASASSSKNLFYNALSSPIVKNILKSAPVYLNAGISLGSIFQSRNHQIFSLSMMGISLLSYSSQKYAKELAVIATVANLARFFFFSSSSNSSQPRIPDGESSIPPLPKKEMSQEDKALLQKLEEFSSEQLTKYREESKPETLIHAITLAVMSEKPKVFLPLAAITVPPPSDEFHQCLAQAYREMSNGNISYDEKDLMNFIFNLFGCEKKLLSSPEIFELIEALQKLDEKADKKILNTPNENLFQAAADKLAGVEDVKIIKSITHFIYKILLKENFNYTCIDRRRLCYLIRAIPIAKQTKIALLPVQLYDMVTRTVQKDLKIMEVSAAIDTNHPFAVALKNCSLDYSKSLFQLNEKTVFSPYLMRHIRWAMDKRHLPNVTEGFFKELETTWGAGTEEEKTRSNYNKEIGK